jgi:cytochrome c peroxidase
MMHPLSLMTTLAMLLLGCSGDSTQPTEPSPTEEAETKATPEEAAKTKYASVFKTLPEHMHKGATPSDAMITLGRMLYYETRLSKNHDLSCNSCHPLDNFGADGEPTSPGHKGARGDRNSPTSYNAALHIAQFWDGRAPDVEAQAKGPVLNPGEMAMADEATVEAVLQSIPGYVDAFAAAFPDAESAITYDHMATAIGAFERGLVTPSPFDAYLGGDVTALTDAQIAGLDTFVSTGCVTCHSGPTLGGAMYQKLGAVHPYETEDEGRFKVTHDEADKYVFKVPSLRNIAKTGPYFHDGSVTELSEAIKKMGYHQLGVELDEAQIGSIATFLDALTGQVPTEYIAQPTAPASGPKTPAADPT